MAAGKPILHTRTHTRGFTLVEVIIVIAVLAIITTIVTVSMLSYLTNGRDAQRTTSAEMIASALEKYYEENGEYPGCAAITQPGDAVRQSVLKGLDAQALVTPNATAGSTNTITCGEIGDTNDDIFSYVGDSTAACTTGPACAQWTLSYRDEASGEIKTISSRRKAEAIATKPSVLASATGMNSASVEWTPVQEAVSYELQRSSNAGFTSVTTTSHTGLNTNVSGLTPSTTYYFRVRALLPSSKSVWSDVDSTTTSSVGGPTGTITITAAVSGANMLGTTAGGTCPAGATIERQIRINVNNGGWQGWVAANSSGQRSVAVNEGITHAFQGQARCVLSGVASSWIASGSASATRPVTAPSGLTMAAALSGTNAVGTAGGGACAAGTTLERQIQYHATATASAGSWSSWAAGASRTVAANPGYKYTFQQQARCAGTNASSGWVASSEASTVRGISNLAVPTISVNAGTRTWSWGSAACPAGTTREFQYQFTSNVASAGAWTATTATSATNSSAVSQGVTYGLNVRVRCYTPHTTNAWSGAASTNFVVRVVHSGAHRLAVKLNKNSSYPGDGQARMKIKDYAGACASGTVRESVIQAQYDTSGGGAWYSGNFFTATSNNIERNVDDSQWGGWVVAGEMIEARTRSRCRNTTTGYATDASGNTVTAGSYDIGNMYMTKAGDAYKIACTPVTGVTAFCGGGYNSGGTLVQSSLIPCTTRAGGISDVTRRYTALIPIGTNGPANSCWNI